MIKKSKGDSFQPRKQSVFEEDTRTSLSQSDSHVSDPCHRIFY